MSKKLSYEEIMEITLNTIKEETDYVWEATAEGKGIIATTVSGIMELFTKLEIATKSSKEFQE